MLSWKLIRLELMTVWTSFRLI